MDMTLRQSAEERLQKGCAPLTRGLPVGTNALALLHDLASTPKTASAALKLLHELQVHQVELDLQQEQAEQERLELTDELAHYAALFELAPFAYLSLDHEGLVMAANRIAADWLVPCSGEANGWAGCRIENLLAAECREAVTSMLAALHKGEGRQACAMQSKAGGASAQVMATATLGSAGQVLIAFLPAGH